MPKKADTTKTTPANTKKNLVGKLAEIMAAIDHVDKRGKNTGQNYTYVKATDVARIVRKELSDRNVVMIPDIVEVDAYDLTTSKGNQMQGIRIRVKYTFHDGDSGETVSFHGVGVAHDSGDKAIYKAQTGALKYAMRNAFLVPDESDPEGDNSVDKAGDARRTRRGNGHGRVVKGKDVDANTAALKEISGLCEEMDYTVENKRNLWDDHKGDITKILVTLRQQKESYDANNN